MLHDSALPAGAAGSYPVSYTHLDVYKRQTVLGAVDGPYKIVVTKTVTGQGDEKLTYFVADVLAVSYTHLCIPG